MFEGPILGRKSTFGNTIKKWSTTHSKDPWRIAMTNKARKMSKQSNIVSQVYLFIFLQFPNNKVMAKTFPMNCYKCE